MIKINTIRYLFLFFLEEIMISKVNFCDSSKIFSQSYRQYLLEIESLLYLKKKRATKMVAPNEGGKDSNI